MLFLMQVVENKDEFDGLMEDGMQNMALEVIEQHELNKWNSMIAKYAMNSAVEWMVHQC